MSILAGFIGSDTDFQISEKEMDNLVGEIGQLDRANPIRRKAVSKLARKAGSKGGGVVPTKNLSAKAEFESRLYLLPDDVVAGLKSQQMQIVDKTIYSNKSIDVAAYSELMVNSDVSVPGVTNINNRKLETNQFFLLTGITLLSGTGADAKAVSYGEIAAIIKNGDFQLRVGEKIVIPRTSCYIFDTAGQTNVQKGYYKLENPKIIPPQTEIKPELWSAGANAANTCVRIVLHGAIVEKN